MTIYLHIICSLGPRTESHFPPQHIALKIVVDGGGDAISSTTRSNNNSILVLIKACTTPLSGNY